MSKRIDVNPTDNLVARSLCPRSSRAACEQLCIELKSIMVVVMQSIQVSFKPTRDAGLS
jgi:hypothetical protein